MPVARSKRSYKGPTSSSARPEYTVSRRGSRSPAAPASPPPPPPHPAATSAAASTSRTAAKRAYEPITPPLWWRAAARPPAVDEPPGDRAPAAPPVHGNGAEQLPARVDVVPAVADHPLEGAPAEVGELTLARRQDVDLLLAVLADVADPHVAGLAVEGEAPRVAQAVREGFPPRARAAHVEA